MDLRNFGPAAGLAPFELPQVDVIENADATIVNGFDGLDQRSGLFSRNRDIDNVHVAFASVPNHLGKMITGRAQDPD